MNEEEKQAIEILRNFEPDDLVECSIYIQAVEKITNLIDKQQKEIEELKDFNVKLQATKDRLDSYDKENTLEIEKLKKEIEDLKNDHIDFWINTKEVEDMVRGKFINKDKIKEKIEELEKPIQEGQCLNVIQGYVREGNLILLKELLGE